MESERERGKEREREEERERGGGELILIYSQTILRYTVQVLPEKSNHLGDCKNDS